MARTDKPHLWYETWPYATKVKSWGDVSRMPHATRWDAQVHAQAITEKARGSVCVVYKVECRGQILTPVNRYKNGKAAGEVRNG